MTTLRKAEVIALLGLMLASCAPVRSLVRFKDPLTSEEHVQLGVLYERQQKWGPAEREYKAAVRGNKKNVPALLTLGNLLYSQGRQKEAAAVFKKAVQADPDNAAASNNLAMIYASQKKNLKKAERLAERAERDDRIRPYALDTLALIYIHQGRFDKARAALEKAAAARPETDGQYTDRLRQTAQLLHEKQNLRSKALTKS